MSKISPKVIDVEGNRIETDDIMPTRLHHNKSGNINRSIGSGNIEYLETSYIQNKNGRFPTQLFTNITDDKYKYVKRI